MGKMIKAGRIRRRQALNFFFSQNCAFRAGKIFDQLESVKEWAHILELGGVDRTLNLIKTRQAN